MPSCSASVDLSPGGGWIDETRKRRCCSKGSRGPATASGTLAEYAQAAGTPPGGAVGRGRDTGSAPRGVSDGTHTPAGVHQAVVLVQEFAPTRGPGPG